MEGSSSLYRVEIIGFSEDERALFSSTFALSARRAKQFEQFEAHDRDDRPDVYLVDGDNISAMVEFMTREPSAIRPGILVGTDAQGTDWPLIARPIKWTRLFNELDVAVERAFHAKLDLARSEESMVGSVYSKRKKKKYDINLGASTTDNVGQHLSDTMFQNTMPNGQLAQLMAGSSSMMGAVRVSTNEGVLVVGSDPTDRQFVASRLLPFGLFVDSAENAEQTIAMLDHKRYAVAIIEISMRGVDGFTLCKLIKARRNEATPAVILCSSKASSFDRVRGKMAGCDAYLAKPFDDDQLVAAVARHLPQTSEDDWVASQIFKP